MPIKQIETAAFCKRLRSCRLLSVRVHKFVRFQSQAPEMPRHLRRSAEYSLLICEKLAFLFRIDSNRGFRLAFFEKHWYNFLENKNAAAYGCANTRKPAQVSQHLHNDHMAAPHGYYKRFSAFLQAPSVSLFYFCGRFCTGIPFLRCVGVYPAQLFCFHPARAEHSARLPR